MGERGVKKEGRKVRYSRSIGSSKVSEVDPEWLISLVQLYDVDIAILVILLTLLVT